MRETLRLHWSPLTMRETDLWDSKLLKKFYEIQETEELLWWNVGNLCEMLKSFDEIWKSYSEIPEILWWNTEMVLEWSKIQLMCVAMRFFINHNALQNILCRQLLKEFNENDGKYTHYLNFCTPNLVSRVFCTPSLISREIKALSLFCSCAAATK